MAGNGAESRPDTHPHILRFTDTAILVRNITDHHTQHIAAVVRHRYPDASTQNGIRSILITHPHLPQHATDLHTLITTAISEQPSPRTPQTPTDNTATTIHAAPVLYTGDDLHRTAASLNITVPELVTAHTTTTWRVHAMGFAPGFAYLLPEGPHSDLWRQLPRRDTPRQHVPAGSVAVANGYSAIYPQPMPGGWHLLGTTPLTLFNPHNPNPALLHPGDTVHFHATTPATPDTP